MSNLKIGDIITKIHSGTYLSFADVITIRKTLPLMVDLVLLVVLSQVSDANVVQTKVTFESTTLVECLCIGGMHDI